jgi:hypothetical protein
VWCGSGIEDFTVAGLSLPRSGFELWHSTNGEPAASATPPSEQPKKGRPLRNRGPDCWACGADRWLRSNPDDATTTGSTCKQCRAVACPKRQRGGWRCR